METLKSAAEVVEDAATNGSYLDARLRDAMKVTAEAARALSEEATYRNECDPLKKLITHMIIYQGYEKNGYNKMSSDMKRLYDAVFAEMDFET